MEGITGLEMKNLGSGKYSMEFPQYGFLYYNSRHENVLYDLTTMASAVYATGNSTIKMSVKHKDQEWAMEMGRKAFEACLRAGFEEGTTPDPKDPNKTISNIKIEVNGEVKTAEELFKGKPERLAEIKRVAAEQAAKRKNYIDNPISKTTDSNAFKAALQADIQKVETERAEKEAKAGGPAPK